MITLTPNTDYSDITVTPDWFKAERYDFCEDFRIERKHSRNFFVNLITSIFA